jgi:hypothetical protein
MIGMYDVDNLDLSETGGTIPFIDGTNVDNVVMVAIRTKDDAAAVIDGIRDQLDFGLCYRGARIIDGSGKTFTAAGNYAAVNFIIAGETVPSSLFLDINDLGDDYPSELMMSGSTISGKGAVSGIYFMPVDMTVMPEFHTMPDMG